MAPDTPDGTIPSKARYVEVKVAEETDDANTRRSMRLIICGHSVPGARCGYPVQEEAGPEPEEEVADAARPSSSNDQKEQNMPEGEEEIAKEAGRVDITGNEENDRKRPRFQEASASSSRFDSHGLRHVGNDMLQDTKVMPTTPVTVLDSQDDTLDSQVPDSFYDSYYYSGSGEKF